MQLFVPQQAILNQLLEQRRTGYLTRRAFLKRASEIGLAGGLAGMFLESCEKTAQQPASKNATTITWETEEDHYGSFKYLTRKFSQFYPEIQVQIMERKGSCDPHDDLVNKLQAHQGSPDVLSLDIPWMDEFVCNGWIKPLTDSWMQDNAKNYLQKPLQAVTFQDPDTRRQQIWAAPLHTDIGLLYYRKDFPAIIPGPPQTWQDLEEMARLAQKKGSTWGYVWQGAAYDGLVCNFVEVLSSYNASIFDPHAPQTVTINSPEAVEALTKMVSWVGTISPPTINTYKEKDAVDQWLGSHAAFMRCWPNISAWSKDTSQSSVAQKFAIAPLPSHAKSCLGGWQLAINRYSKNQDAAWKFIQWMLQEEAQHYLAVKEGFTVTLASIYKNKDLQAWNPLFALLDQPSVFSQKQSLLETLLDDAQLRPVLPCFSQVASTIEYHINRALVRSEKPAAVLQNLQTELEKVVQHCQMVRKPACSSS